MSVYSYWNLGMGEVSGRGVCGHTGLRHEVERSSDGTSVWAYMIVTHFRHISEANTMYL